MSAIKSMDTTRKLALAAGVLYLVTFAASIPTLAMKAPIADHADFVLGHGSTTPVIWAGFFDFICAVAGIGTAVALYPVTRRYSRTSAIGFLSSRTLEAAILVVGAISLLSVVTLRNGVTGGDPSALVTAGQSLLAQHDLAFLFGPGFMPAINAVFLATVMYRFDLVPRWIPVLGFIGAPLLFASSLATLLGGHGQISETATVFALPIAAWEFSLGVYMAVKGFKRTAVDLDAPVTNSPVLAA
jgi:hypothetical protein